MRHRRLERCCGVHLRPCPSAGVGAGRTSGGTVFPRRSATRADQRAFVDIDYCCAGLRARKQGASYGHTKIAGNKVLRKGLSPLATTISTRWRAGDRRDAVARRAGQLRQGGGRMVAQAIATARAAGASGQIWCAVTAPTAPARSSVPPAAAVPILAGPDQEHRVQKRSTHPKRMDPVRYPGAVKIPTPGCGSLMPRSRNPYTALASTKDAITARLMLRSRRPPPRRSVPGMAVSPFFTNSDERSRRDIAL